MRLDLGWNDTISSWFLVAGNPQACRLTYRKRVAIHRLQYLQDCVEHEVYVGTELDKIGLACQTWEIVYRRGGLGEMLNRQAHTIFDFIRVLCGCHRITKVSRFVSSRRNKGIRTDTVAGVIKPPDRGMTKISFGFRKQALKSVSQRRMSSSVYVIRRF